MLLKLPHLIATEACKQEKALTWAKPSHKLTLNRMIQNNMKETKNLAKNLHSVIIYPHVIPKPHYFHTTQKS